jgi:polyphosphate:AMP phosphotransferase
VFESAELGHRIDRKTFAKEVPALREALLAAQFELSRKASFPVVILLSGVDTAGKGETVNILNEWMDPRHIQTNAMGEPTDEERERPPMWRFWRALPPKGKIGIFFGSWYTVPINDRAFGRSSESELDEHLGGIVRFERMLTAEGALLLKFWLHLPKKEQSKRLKNLEKDRRTRWRVTKEDWQRHKMYGTFRRVSEQALRRTSTAEAPWTVVEGTDPNYRYLTIGKVLLEALKARLGDGAAKAADRYVPPRFPAIDRLKILETLDLSLSVPKKRYQEELPAFQERLARLLRHPKFDRMSAIAVFEGFDAAGKGGAIRRITGALDARQYKIASFAAPTEEERAMPYLWRFWRQIPRYGGLTIFDRSWYGRVLVERVEGLCTASDWMRAYGEINDFESQLIRNRTVFFKFWLSIDKNEQLRRFRDREKTPFKRFKITAEDWRNRKKWDAYVEAVCDMVDRTSTEIAPWTLVEANDKFYARLKILKTLCQGIEAAVK